LDGSYIQLFGENPDSWGGQLAHTVGDQKVKNFGEFYVSSYENDWLENIYGDQWANEFEAGMKDNGYIKKFSVNFKNKSDYLRMKCCSLDRKLSDNKEPYGAELVDILYIKTHGSPGGLAQWEANQVVMAQEMRLGDGSRPLSVLATTACSFLKGYDDQPNYFKTWKPIFNGGLKTILGFRSTHVFSDWLYDNKSNQEMMKTFAHNLKTKKLWKAWSGAFGGNDNEPAAIFTGINPKHCLYRMRNMSFTNMGNFVPLRDENVKSFCISASIKATDTAFQNAMEGIQNCTISVDNFRECSQDFLDTISIDDFKFW